MSIKIKAFECLLNQHKIAKRYIRIRDILYGLYKKQQKLKEQLLITESVFNKVIDDPENNELKIETISNIREIHQQIFHKFWQIERKRFFVEQLLVSIWRIMGYSYQKTFTREKPEMIIYQPIELRQIINSCKCCEECICYNI